jgi:CO/xanthine dehydrogenase Mo-binding subunit
MADYMIPTSLDFPAIESTTFDNPYPYGPAGAKGAGEVVFDGLAPALASAVEKAIGGPVHEVPVTPERIAELLRGRREADDSIRPEWIRAVDNG